MKKPEQPILMPDGQKIPEPVCNLSDADRSDLHGTMTGDMRNGPITITINLDAEQRLFAPAVPPVHLAAH